MGFITTSTIHTDSTVLFHIPHDKVNLYEHEDLPVHPDTICYKSSIKRHYFPTDSLPPPRNCHSVQVLSSPLPRHVLVIHISSK